MKTLVTIYVRSSFMGNVVRVEGVLVEHGTRPFAQYPAAPYVTFIPRGKRKPRTIIEAESSPWLLVLEGWETPEPDSPLVVVKESTPGMQCAKSRYMSFAPEWTADFDDLIDPLIRGGKVKVFVDCRKKKQEAT